MSNTRAQRLLDLAHKFGLAVDQSTVVADCWTIRKISGDWGSPSITVYAAPRNSAHVMYDSGHGQTWEQITQSHARSLIVNGAL